MEEIATVYARSLFEVAKEQDKLDEIREQLGQVADALDADRELQIFFFSPYFSTEEKQDGLRKVIDGAEPAVLNFLELLVENHRTPALFRIRREYDQLWEHENKLLPVEITSAVELDDEIARRIGDEIGEQTGQRVELTKTVDPDIIGGLVLRVGNSILDASIRNRLDNLRKNVAKAA
jgi:F-type H+-transporting ATPase subunit delta